MSTSPRKRRVLDLCCGVGGAGMGYHRAGFEVVGVDLHPQPNYPFEFHQADALDFVREHGAGFDLIHGSWPCQHHSALTKGTNQGREYPDLIPAGRAAMLTTGRPLVIENVQGSTVRRDLTLCGEMFGLAVIRHRYFEIHGFPTLQYPHVPHRGRVAGMRHGQWYQGPYFAVYGEGGGKGTVPQWQQAMGIDWTDVRHEIAEAIPPAYTQHLAEQFLDHLAAEVTA
ncbi:DNA cytosine methyltransferase [Streptomyces sp. NBC_01381]|uniref:DNA cytosine methyltransferase n=1 Tax=Streptomyces sp. NBC_01381 TaxID=2903845 RepID=UPI0022508CB3|nr:DNA cytosine methyltransferase [Streptomyces sp. NBC_01381]MCX4672848.1 DNA cytosine methyltransferase [Streptomyces sp. NBC_01381]